MKLTSEQKYQTVKELSNILTQAAFLDKESKRLKKVLLEYAKSTGDTDFKYPDCGVTYVAETVTNTFSAEVCKAQFAEIYELCKEAKIKAAYIRR